jgi:hypothetical protein
MATRIPGELEVNRIQGNCGTNRSVLRWLPDTEMWLLVWSSQTAGEWDQLAPHCEHQPGPKRSHSHYTSLFTLNKIRFTRKCADYYCLTLVTYLRVVDPSAFINIQSPVAHSRSIHLEHGRPLEYSDVLVGWVSNIDIHGWLGNIKSLVTMDDGCISAISIQQPGMWIKAGLRSGWSETPSMWLWDALAAHLLHFSMLITDLRCLHRNILSDMQPNLFLVFRILSLGVQLCGKKLQRLLSTGLRGNHFAHLGDLRFSLTSGDWQW